MGLIDFYAADDDFALPDFDASFSPSKRESPAKADSNASTASQTSSQASSSPLKTPDSPTASVTSTGPKPSKRPSKHNRRRSTFSKPPKPAPGKCFDLFGEDENLQTAEPKINFCDLCFRHCDIH